MTAAAIYEIIQMVFKLIELDQARGVDPNARYDAMRRELIADSDRLMQEELAK